MSRGLKYFLVGLFSMILGGSLVYFRMDISKNKEPVQEEQKKEPVVVFTDGIKLRHTIAKEDSTINQVYDITINGVQKRLSIVFTLEESWNTFSIIGNINDVNIFYYEGNKSVETIEEILTPNFIEKMFNENNFSLIKGIDDKNYLTVFNFNNVTNNRYYYIYNQNMTLLNREQNINILYESAKISLEGGADIWYNDSLEICSTDSTCQVKAKIVNNKIYNLVPKMNEVPVEGDYGELEEYIYMVGHDRIISDLISTYKITNYIEVGNQN